MSATGTAFAWDVAALRRDTPGCNVADPPIHLNNAGSSLSPAPVVDIVSNYLRSEQLLGGYEAAASQSAAVQSVYDDLATLINASASEISHAENATRAWWLAFASLASGRARAGSVILAAATEYGSNELAMLQCARRYGARVHFLENDASGAVDVPALAALLATRPATDFLCVSLAWIATNGGLVQRAAAIGEACAAAGVPFLLDACQALGQVVVDVQSVRCDAMAGTGRKFLRGPRGVGFLYVRADGCLADVEPAMLDIRAATLESDGEGYRLAEGSARWESWERPYALWLGLGRAARYAQGIGMERIEKRVAALAQFLRALLAENSKVVVLDQGGGREGSRCGIVSFRLTGLDCLQVKNRLAGMGANVSVSSSSSTRRDMTQRGIADVVRASVHYFNTEEELTRVAGFLVLIGEGDRDRLDAGG